VEKVTDREITAELFSASGCHGAQFEYTQNNRLSFHYLAKAIVVVKVMKYGKTIRSKCCGFFQR
jgi:hypothetical protein